MGQLKKRFANSDCMAVLY